MKSTKKWGTAAVVSAILLTAVPAGAQSFAAEFPARIVAAHNAARASVGAQPLVWDNDLGSAAAAYAQWMAMTGNFQHSDRSARHGVGENLWMGTRGAFSIEAMVGNWTSERRWFVPGVFPNVSADGNWADVAHYTQVIWPGTQRVGCALASTANTDYLVCRYGAAGNMDGKWVGPARSERAPATAALFRP
jgi:hypothetical protein